MLERVLNTSLQLYLFHALQLKNREDKPYQYQSVQRIFSKHTLRETYSWFPTNCHKNKPIWKCINLPFFRLIIFAIYFPLKLIFSTVQMYLFDQKFLCLSKESWLAFIKIIVNHFYHIMNALLNIDWLASYSSYKTLIGSFEFIRKPVKILLTACY